MSLEWLEKHIYWDTSLLLSFVGTEFRENETANFRGICDLAKKKKWKKELIFSESCINKLVVWIDPTDQIINFSKQCSVLKWHWTEP